MPNLLIQPAPVPSWGLAQQRAAQTRGMQNRNLLAERQLQDYPEEQEWKRESRQITREEHEYTKHLRDFKTSMEPLAKLEAIDKMLRLSSKNMTLRNHDSVSANIHRQFGISSEQGQAGESAAQIAEQARAEGQDPETYYQKVWKPKQLMIWEQKFELMKVEAGKTPEAPVMGSEAWKRAKEFEAGLSKSEKDPVFIKKRDELMKVYGVDEKTATGLATGTVKINTNPVSGESVIVDTLTGTSKPIVATETPSTKPKPTPPKQTLWEMADLSTGILSAGKAAWGATAGQIGLPIAEKTEYARQRVRSAQQKLVRSLSINPRYPVAEMTRIKEETRIAPEIFDSSQSLRVRMRAVNDYLESEIITNQSIASNPKMPTEQRKNALQSVEAMQSFLRELGVPKESPKELEGQAGANLSKEDTDLINKYLTK